MLCALNFDEKDLETRKADSYISDGGRSTRSVNFIA
jgi:hypothetical protein